MREFRLEETLKVSPNKVWDTLVNPEKIKHYLFGSLTESDWHEGASIAFYQLEDGERKKVAHGIIQEWKPPQRLAYTLFPSQSSIPDTPDNYLHVLFEIEAKGPQSTSLKIIQTGFDRAADGENRYQESLAGWKQALPLFIKTAESEG